LESKSGYKKWLGKDVKKMIEYIKKEMELGKV